MEGLLVTMDIEQVFGFGENFMLWIEIILINHVSIIAEWLENILN